jgi:hypothetical protein
MLTAQYREDARVFERCLEIAAETAEAWYYYKRRSGLKDGVVFSAGLALPWGLFRTGYRLSLCLLADGSEGRRVFCGGCALSAVVL